MSSQRLRGNLGILIALLAAFFPNETRGRDSRPAMHLRGALITAEMATDVRLQKLRSAGYSAAVLMLAGADEQAARADREAVERIGKACLDVYYWIEVGPCPEFADAHPRWMAAYKVLIPSGGGSTKIFANPRMTRSSKRIPGRPSFIARRLTPT